MTPARRLRERLQQPGVMAMPGAHDGLTAKLAEDTGFEAVFVSGAGIALSRFGIPDLGLVSVTEFASAVSAITAQLDIPAIADIDTGFGNALNAARTMREIEAAGAAGVQIEDQTFPKRCGHIKGKSVIASREMADKVRACVDARRNPDTVVIARTDAVAVEGLEAACDRAELYLEAGADAIFIEAPSTYEDMIQIARQFSHRVPLVQNLVEGGQSPVRDIAGLETLGYKIALFPLAFLHAAVPAGHAMLKHLKSNGATATFPAPQYDLKALNELVDIETYLQRAGDYASGD